METRRTKKEYMEELENGAFSEKTTRSTEVVITEDEIRRVVQFLVVVHKVTTPIQILYKGIGAVISSVGRAVTRIAAHHKQRKEEKKLFKAWLAVNSTPTDPMIPQCFQKTENPDELETA